MPYSTLPLDSKATVSPTPNRWLLGIICSFVPVILSLLAADARAELVFSGYATVGRQIRFVLNETVSNRTSNWILLGDKFLGHTLVGFDRGTDTLSVRNSSTLIELPLKPSRVVPRNVVVIDSVAMLDASKIPEMRAEVLGSNRIPIADADRIKLIIEILKDASVVSLGGGNGASRGVTHLLWTPNLWMYQAETGRIAMVSKERSPVYQVRREDKDLLERLLAGAPPNTCQPLHTSSDSAATEVASDQGSGETRSRGRDECHSTK